MRFYVTSTQVTHLSRWLGGERIPSRIVEQSVTLREARDLVVQLNERSGGEDATQFYFLTLDRALLP